MENEWGFDGGLMYIYLLPFLSTPFLPPSLPPSPPSLSPSDRWLTGILADLVHHIRSSLPLPHLSLAVHLFSKNVHDDTLPVSIQTMSCKLLLNLVECIRLKAETDAGVCVCVCVCVSV